MKKENVPYERQIFVCTNEQAGENSCCGAQKGGEVFKELRRVAKEKGLHPRIRVAQAKCLGKCSVGVNVIVYPENIWYSDVSMEDIKELVDQHI